jgi:hypothetical protein
VKYVSECTRASLPYFHLECNLWSNFIRKVEFRKGDIEDRIPVELAADKVKAFKEIYRILKKGSQGRMAISDLATSKEVHSD